MACGKDGKKCLENIPDDGVKVPYGSLSPKQETTENGIMWKCPYCNQVVSGNFVHNCPTIEQIMKTNPDWRVRAAVLKTPSASTEQVNRLGLHDEDVRVVAVARREIRKRLKSTAEMIVNCVIEPDMPGIERDKALEMAWRILEGDGTCSQCGGWGCSWCNYTGEEP